MPIVCPPDKEERKKKKGKGGGQKFRLAWGTKMYKRRKTDGGGERGEIIVTGVLIVSPLVGETTKRKAKGGQGKRNEKEWRSRREGRAVVGGRQVTLMPPHEW